MSIKDSIKLRLKKLKYQILYPRSVFEYEVARIRISNENIRRYRFQHFKKDFFSISIQSKDDVFKYLYYLLIIVLFFALPIIGVKNGISDKEIEQNHRAELLYQYYADGNSDILEYNNAKTQTQLVDFLCYCTTKWLHIESVYDVRHVVGALFAWLIIVVLGSFLMNLFSWRAAFFGGLMLALSPHFFGQSFGNLADISFTFFYILAVHQISILIGELPVLKWKRLVFLILSIAASNAVHIGGFVLLHYLLIGVILSFIISNPISKFFTKKYFWNFTKLLLIMIGVIAAVYALYLLCPLQNLKSLALFPSSGVLKMAQNQPITQILWNHQILSSHDLTVNFVFQRMQFTIPLLIIIGTLVHFTVIRHVVKKIHFTNLIILFLATLHPLLTLRGETYEIYDGWAIYMMIYPFVVMFAAAGYEGILRKIDDKYTNFVIVSLVFLLCLMPLRHLFFHYNTLEVYYNELSGGISSAYGKYSIDEGETANRSACLWVIDNAESQTDTSRIRVLTDGNYGCDYYFRKHGEQFIITHSTLQQADTMQWDYFISFAHAVPQDQLLDNTWENREAVHKIYVENKPIALIFQNTPPQKESENTHTVPTTIADSRDDDPPIDETISITDTTTTFESDTILEDLNPE